MLEDSLPAITLVMDTPWARLVELPSTLFDIRGARMVRDATTSSLHTRSDRIIIYYQLCPCGLDRGKRGRTLYFESKRLPSQSLLWTADQLVTLRRLYTPRV